MTQTSPPPSEPEMRSEYDFSTAVRGRHHKPLQKGYTVQIHHGDGTTTQHQHALPEGVVWLDPDVRQQFPDSEAGMVQKSLQSYLYTSASAWPQATPRCQEGVFFVWAFAQTKKTPFRIAEPPQAARRVEPRFFV